MVGVAVPARMLGPFYGSEVSPMSVWGGRSPQPRPDRPGLGLWLAALVPRLDGKGAGSGPCPDALFVPYLREQQQRRGESRSALVGLPSRGKPRTARQGMKRCTKPTTALTLSLWKSRGT